jgi:hypothetical protein
MNVYLGRLLGSSSAVAGECTCAELVEAWKQHPLLAINERLKRRRSSSSAGLLIYFKQEARIEKTVKLSRSFLHRKFFFANTGKSSKCPFINADFFLWLQPCNCFSRAKASAMRSYSSQ